MRCVVVFKKVMFDAMNIMLGANSFASTVIVRYITLDDVFFGFLTRICAAWGNVKIVLESYHCGHSNPLPPDLKY